MSSGIKNHKTDILKVFFAQSPLENVAVFKNRRTTNSTHFLCSYVTMHFRAYPILSKCGVLHRLLLFGFCYNLLMDRR